MERSNKRILTTHVGRLQRPDELTAAMDAHPAKRPVAVAFKTLLRESVKNVVALQADAGIDVVTDGEFGKLSWHSYLMPRMTGFELLAHVAPASSAAARDRKDFAEFYADLRRSGATYFANAGGEVPQGKQWICTGPITYVGQAAIGEDLANLRDALELTPSREAFMPATAPLVRGGAGQNRYYPSEDALLEAMADAMRVEYRAIVDAGFILQIDDPRMPAQWDSSLTPPTLPEYRSWAARHAELINHALSGIPEERVRYHICWGSWHGPHVHDIALQHLIDILLRIRAQGYAFEAANVRHEHEWEAWKNVKLPEGKVLIPGLVSHATNIVEHPDLIASRIKRFASVVARENVIAGTDCGLGYRVHPQIAWAKLRALADGARRASADLWGG